MTCAACGSARLAPWAQARDVEYKSVPEAFTYLRCEDCQALSLERPPTDRLAEIYPPSYYSFSDAGAGVVQGVKDRLDRRWFRAMLRSVPGNELTALDIGGGAGRELDALRQADPRVTRTTVVDLDAGAETVARAAGHEYVRARIEDAPLQGHYDVILLLNLIEHVANPLAVLERVRALLAPHGKVLVKTPNTDSLDARLFRRRNWGGYHCPRHWVLFTPGSFASLAERAGLRVARWRYTQGAPFWTVSVLAWLDELGLATITRDRPAWVHPLYAPLAAVFATFDFLRRPVASLSQMTFELTNS